MSTANQEVVVAPSNVPVKFLGRSNNVLHSEAVYVQTMNQLVKVTNDLKSIATNDDSWGILVTEMAALTNYFLNPDQTVKRYQLELVVDGLLPYLKKLNGRIHFDRKRFGQINTIIHSIMNNNLDHPAQSLQALDEVVADLKSKKSYIWKSELLTLLESATEKQWQPIIADNRSILQNIGGKFLIVGLIGVVGWPMAFMYPLYRVALNMARIASELEKNKSITMETGIEVAKTLAVIFAATQLLSILSIYASLGHFCLLCGVVAIAISMNKSWIKQLAPVMAPHVVQIDQVLSLIGSIDHSKIRGAMMQHAAVASGAADNANRTNNERVSTGNNSATAFRTSSRVEELPDTSNTVDLTSDMDVDQTSESRNIVDLTNDYENESVFHDINQANARIRRRK